VTSAGTSGIVLNVDRFTLIVELIVFKYVVNVLKVEALFAPPIFAIFELLILDTLIFRNDPSIEDSEENNTPLAWRFTNDPEYEESEDALTLDPWRATKDPE
jgi:hypothetical protein